MAKRIFKAMPIWGLSALVAGSVGASLSDPGQAVILSHIAPTAKSHDIAIDPRSRPLPTPPLGAALRPSLASAEAPGSQRKRAKTGMRHRARAPQMLQAGRSPEPLPSAIAPMLAIPAPLAKPAEIVGQPAKGAGNAVFAQPLAPPARLIAPAANAVATPKISANPAIAKRQPANNLSVYGTSAQNAYKVYFPQVDAPGAGGDAANASGGQPDKRVLTKQGDYLFFSDAKAGSSDAIKSGLEASGASENKAVLDAIAAAKNAKPAELTAPALQKQPLNFGDRELEPMPRSSGAPDKNAAEKSDAN